MLPTTRGTQRTRHVELRLPSLIRLDPDRRQERGTIRVLPAGKAPRLRFQPGSFIRYGGKLWEIMFAYRLATNPAEWLYCCEQRQELVSGEPSSVFPGLTEALGAGATTPLVVREIFHDTMQMHEFFADIPTGRDRVAFTNKQLMQGAQLVSSGEVLEPERKAIEP